MWIQHKTIAIKDATTTPSFAWTQRNHNSHVILKLLTICYRGLLQIPKNLVVVFYPSKKMALMMREEAELLFYIRHGNLIQLCGIVWSDELIGWAMPWVQYGALPEFMENNSLTLSVKVGNWGYLSLKGHYMCHTRYKHLWIPTNLLLKQKCIQRVFLWTLDKLE